MICDSNKNCEEEQGTVELGDAEAAISELKHEKWPEVGREQWAEDATSPESWARVRRASSEKEER